MAFEEVQLTEEEKAGLSAKFVKFDAIGDKFVGRFVRTQPATGKYSKQGDLGYVFRAKDTHGVVAEWTLEPNAGLAAQLKKAALQPNYAVRITFNGEQDTGKESPLKLFKVEVDRVVSTAAAPPPPPPPKPAAAADDIDY